MTRRRLRQTLSEMIEFVEESIIKTEEAGLNALYLKQLWGMLDNLLEG